MSGELLRLIYAAAKWEKASHRPRNYRRRFRPLTKPLRKWG